jgi:hypothetical protein
VGRRLTTAMIRAPALRHAPPSTARWRDLAQIGV